MAISADTAVVGAYFEGSAATGVNGNQADNSKPAAGAAYVFVRNGTAWGQQAYLKASNTDADDFFGLSVTISGNSVVVGARGESSAAIGVNGNQSDNTALYSGAAYAFVRTGTTWTQQAYLKASDTKAGDSFGSVAISGNTLIVGAAGAAYLFVRNGATWTQQAYLTVFNSVVARFGSSPAVDGSTMVVGATAEGNSGAAYVFADLATSTTFTVTPSAGANGSISPNTVQMVTSGASVSFTATPNSGFVVNQWLVNGSVAQTGGTSFTLSNVTANKIVQVTFKQGVVNTNVDFSQGDYLLFNPTTHRTAIWDLQNGALLRAAFGPTLPAGWTLICVADINRDGKLDYVLLNPTTRQTAVWFLNNITYAGGTFGPTLPAGWTLTFVADLNRDGKPDYVLFNPSTRQTAAWFLNGTTYFSGAFCPTLPAGWSLIDVKDFNGDGKPDFVLTNATTRQTALWYLNGTSFSSGAFGPTLPAGWTLQGRLISIMTANQTMRC